MAEMVVKLTFEEIALKVQAFALSWQKGHDRKPRAKIWKELGKGNIRFRVGQRSAVRKTGIKLRKGKLGRSSKAVFKLCKMFVTNPKPHQRGLGFVFPRSTETPSKSFLETV